MIKNGITINSQHQKKKKESKPLKQNQPQKKKKKKKKFPTFQPQQEKRTPTQTPPQIHPKLTQKVNTSRNWRRPQLGTIGAHPISITQTFGLRVAGAMARAIVETLSLGAVPTFPGWETLTNSVATISVVVAITETSFRPTI